MGTVGVRFHSWGLGLILPVYVVVRVACWFSLFGCLLRLVDCICITIVLGVVMFGFGYFGFTFWFW